MLVVCEKNKTRVFQPSKSDVLTGNHFMLIVSAQSKASPVDLVPLLRYPYTILQMSTSRSHHHPRHTQDPCCMADHRTLRGVHHRDLARHMSAQIAMTASSSRHSRPHKTGVLQLPSVGRRAIMCCAGPPGLTHRLLIADANTASADGALSTRNAPSQVSMPGVSPTVRPIQLRPAQRFS